LAVQDPTVIIPIATLGLLIFGIIHGIVFASREHNHQEKPHDPPMGAPGNR